MKFVIHLTYSNEFVTGNIENKRYLVKGLGMPKKPHLENIKLNKSLSTVISSDRFQIGRGGCDYTPLPLEFEDDV